MGALSFNSSERSLQVFLGSCIKEFACCLNQVCLESYLLLLDHEAIAAHLTSFTHPWFNHWIPEEPRHTGWMCVACFFFLPVPGEPTFILLPLLKALQGIHNVFSCLRIFCGTITESVSFRLHTGPLGEFLPPRSLFSDGGVMLASAQQVSLRDDYSQRTPQKLAARCWYFSVSLY